jgi:hypothetical protein
VLAGIAIRGVRPILVDVHAASLPPPIMSVSLVVGDLPPCSRRRTRAALADERERKRLYAEARAAEVAHRTDVGPTILPRYRQWILVCGILTSLPC